jgi:hypothetical protein
MALIRRRPVAPTSGVGQVQIEKPAPQVQVTATRPASTLRKTSVNTAADKAAIAEKAKLVIETNLKSISLAERAIDDAQSQITQSTKIIEAQMKLAVLDYHTDGVKEALLKEAFTRQGRKLDPKKFKAHVPDAVFWAAIRVSLEVAGEHLTEKEINEIADVTPSVSQGYKLKVQDVKKR